MITVYTSAGSLTLSANPNETLLSVLHGGGVFVDAPCGGDGRCGKCRVYASGALSEPGAEELSLLSAAELQEGVRLACCARVLGDVTVRIPEAAKQLVQTDDRTGEGRFAPAVRRVSVTVPVPSLEQPTDDRTRLLQTLPGVSAASLTALCHLPAALRAQDGSVDAIVYRDRLLDVGANGMPVLGMAVDIGTTTVAAYFYDLLTGERLATRSGLNPQRAFGADVISRIAACSEEGGLAAQQRVIAQLLSDMAADFAKETDLPAQSIYHVTISANTTMLHLLAGIDPAAIAAAPFISGTLFGFAVPAARLGVAVCPDAPVELLPCISSYVGADITAGMAACGLDQTDERVVYLDIGTNGEMAYCGNGKLLCCSTAAGPAFEGAHIHCGTGGVPGAIDSAKIENDALLLTTIGNQPAVGICGSGLVDLIAALREIEAIDETGRLVDEDELEPPYDTRLNDDGDFVLEGDVVLTAQDVREVQLAKAAICAGIYTLLDTVDVAVDAVDRLVLAGGFGAHISPASACAIGLLPPELLEKVEVVGNAAGAGAVCALLDRDFAARMQDMLARCSYLELSGSKAFQDLYIEQMMFE